MKPSVVPRGQSQRAASGEPPAPRPLVVDVDGTLLRGDLLVEGVLRLLAVSPLRLLRSLLSLAAGRAAMKRKIAQQVDLAPSSLVLEPAVQDEIATAKAAGQDVWLASASDERAVAPLAEAVGARGFFASDGRTNLAGRAKAAALVERFGESGFVYVGNERRDLAVWQKGQRIVGVGVSPRLERRMRALGREQGKEVRLLPGSGGRMRAGWATLRPQHWVKNTLVFAPLVAAHDTEAAHFLLAAAIFAALSACASATYVLNDLLDLPHDRQHPSKRRRPLAAGEAAPLPMAALGALLGAGGLALAFACSTAAGLWVLLYMLGTVAYSMSLKRKLLIDVVVLAVLYMVRVVAGAAVVSVALSPWFLGFFMFVFLTLALVKRQTELQDGEQRHAQAAGRAWHREDVSVVAGLCAAGSVASALILALYLQSPQVELLYRQPGFLWPLCPLVIYWLGRMALLANRGAVDADPLLFALRDRTSWLTGLGVAVAFLLAV